MGWIGKHKDRSTSHLDFFRGEFGDSVLAASSVGSTVYLAYRYVSTEPAYNYVGAVVVLTRWAGDEFWYKDMSEVEGPVEAKCPGRILDMLSPTEDERALAWRDRCRNYRSPSVALSPSQYVKGLGLSCPCCQAQEGEGSSWDYETPFVWQKVTCLNCGASWTDFYQLTGYENLTSGKGER